MKESPAANKTAHLENDSDQAAQDERLRVFLERIESDKQAQLRQIQEDTQRACAEIKAEAYGKSRTLHRSRSIDLRRREDDESTKILSRTRSELRRRRWEALQDVRETARSQIHDALLRLWADPESQASWCLFWLDEARQVSSAAATVFTGTGTLPSTLIVVQNHERIASGNWSVDSGTFTEPGIVIEWANSYLDGTLTTHEPHLLRNLFGELLTGWYAIQGDADL